MVTGCAKTQKGSFRPQNRFSPFSAHISMVLPIARQVQIPFGLYDEEKAAIRKVKRKANKEAKKQEKKRSKQEENQSQQIKSTI